MILLNGALHPRAEAERLLANRGFRLGDSIFETIRIVSGRIQFWPLHWHRLMRGAETLGLALPAHFTYKWVGDRLAELAAAHHINAGGKLRLQVYRTGAEGAYTPVRDDADWLAEATRMLHNQWPSDRTQRLLLWDGWRVYPTILSGIKTGSALPYVMAARAAKAAGADDTLLLDLSGNVVESGRANVFAVVDGQLVTPPLEAGIVDGVLRRVVLQLAMQHNLPIVQASLSPEMLTRANELFTTNVVSGIFPVDYVQGIGRSYPSARPITQRLQAALAKLATSADAIDWSGLSA